MDYAIFELDEKLSPHDKKAMWFRCERFGTFTSKADAKTFYGKEPAIQENPNDYRIDDASEFYVYTDI